MSRLFDGNDDVINCASAAILDDKEPFTLSAWINPATDGELNNGEILYKDTGDSAGGGWQFRHNATNQIQFKKDYSGTDMVVRSVNGAITVNRWQHVACVWDGTATASNVRLYVNGVEVSYSVQTNGTSTKGSDAGNDLLIGNDSVGTRTFNGKIAYCEFFSRMFNINEIKQIMRFPGSIRNGLLFSAPLWGGSPEGDYSGNGNHGTVTGATLSSDNPPINGVFHPPTPNLYYSSFSTGAAPTSATGKINRVMLMGIS